MKRMTRSIATASVASVALIGLLAGCSSPKSRFYTLDPDNTVERASTATPIRVVVGPVTIPDLVDRPQIVTRVSANEVKVNEFARWAEPLKSEISQVIAADLRTMLGSDQVTVFDTGSNAMPAWRVCVDILSLDSEPAVAVSMDALWTIQPPGKQPAIAGRSVVREAVASDGFDAIIAALNRALASVSRDIATSIRTPSGR